MPRTEGLLEEIGALIDAADRAGLPLRLIGGLGVRSSCPSAARPPFAREYSDADCVSTADSAPLQRFIAGQGWKPDREFNMYNGDRRLLFASPAGAKLDVFVGAFRMCHEFRFEGRMPAARRAALPADLLLTKLQIHEINEKDLSDAACVFLDFDILDRGVSDREALGAGRTGYEPASGVEADYIAAACARDWGVYRSITGNLDKTASWVGAAVADAAWSETILGRIARLRDAIDAKEKGVAWRIRSAIGPRARWYEEVEEVDL
ncbi:MAG: hypothetical protein KKA67_12615 [Spirochaetes bacterium]|nr:hypothetical protein [Spirochaetota bacterium]MBU1079670.1 hypothetical protein [Spirochaetota bacterium]